MNSSKESDKVIIGIDFDGTINDMLDTWVSWLNKSHGTSVKVSDITEWELSKQFPKLSKSELFAPLNDPDFWYYVTIKPDAVIVIKDLIDKGHKVFIVTSSHYRTLPAKLDRCLFEHFPFLNKENVIITYDKSLIRCDMLLDDGEHNLTDFPGIRVLFDAPYNTNSNVADYRVHTWKEFSDLMENFN